MSGRAVVIVLAAGLGSRFAGIGHKLMQSLGGSTVLGCTLQQAVASRLEVIVVTTQALAPIAGKVVAARDVVVIPEVGSPGFEGLGMGYSIAAGVSARPDAGGWLIVPGDMPLLRPETLQAVEKALHGHAIAYAQHAGRRGHPVGFSPELYSELIMLKGDEGARRILARYPAASVEVDDAGALIDVDTAADLLRLRAMDAARVQ